MESLGGIGTGANARVASLREGGGGRFGFLEDTFLKGARKLIHGQAHTTTVPAEQVDLAFSRR